MREKFRTISGTGKKSPENEKLNIAGINFLLSLESSNFKTFNIW